MASSESTMESKYMLLVIIFLMYELNYIAISIVGRNSLVYQMEIHYKAIKIPVWRRVHQYVVLLCQMPEGHFNFQNYITVQCQ